MEGCFCPNAYLCDVFFCSCSSQGDGVILGGVLPSSGSSDENPEGCFMENGRSLVLSDTSVNLLAFILDFPKADEEGILVRCRVGGDSLFAELVMKFVSNNVATVLDIVSKIFKWLWSWPPAISRDLVNALARSRAVGCISEQGGTRHDCGDLHQTVAHMEGNCDGQGA